MKSLDGVRSKVKPNLREKEQDGKPKYAVCSGSQNGLD